MYSSQDKSVMLGLLGWSRGGKEKHLPLDIVREIGKFIFFDSRTEEYKEHSEKIMMRERMKHHVVYPLIKDINQNLRVHTYGVHGVQYSPIMIYSECCMRCGEFMNNDTVCERTTCKCVWYTNDEIEQMEYENDEYYEEDMIERRKKELKSRKEDAMKDIDSCSNFDDDYYEWYDECDDYDDYSDRENNPYDEPHEYTHIDYDSSGDYY